MTQYFRWALAAVLTLAVWTQTTSTFAQTATLTDANGFKYQTVANDPTNTRIYTLPNGLTAYLSVNKAEPRVQIAIAVRAGSKHDPQTNTGLAHYLEHMLFKGTQNMGTLDYAKEKAELDVIENLYEKYNHTTDENLRKAIYRQIDSVSSVAAKYAVANEIDNVSSQMGGKNLNAFTSFEQTVYINNLPANQLTRWLKIEGDRYHNPVFRIFHTELEAVYEEKNISLDDENEQVWDSLMSNLFRKHTYGIQTTIGRIEHLKNPSLKAIRNYFDTYYVPNNMAVCLSGDFDPEQAVRLIEENFRWMQPKPVPAFTFEPEVAFKKPVRIEIVGQESESVSMAYRFPGIDTDDALTVELIDQLLANASTGLIDLNLVKKQLVLEAGSFTYALKDYGVQFLNGTPKEGQSLQEVEMLLLEQVEKIKKGDFDEKTLAAILLNNEIQKIKERQNNGSRAIGAAYAFTQYQNWESVVNKIERWRKITKAQIQAVAQKYYTPTNCVVVYKKLGEKPALPKIEKPHITPVPVNREAVSAFTKQLLSDEPAPIQPVFPDYDRLLTKLSLKGGTPLICYPNEEDKLFTLVYRFDFGNAEDRTMAFALEYLKYLGAGEMSAEDVEKKFYALGSSFDIRTSAHQIDVTLTGIETHFEESVKLLERLLTNAAPDAAALKTLIERELKNRADAKSDKAQISQALTAYALHGKFNPFTDRLSTAELSKLNAEELVTAVQDLSRYPHRVFYFGRQKAAAVQAFLDKAHLPTGDALQQPPKREYLWQFPRENGVLFVNYEMVQAELAWLTPTTTFSAAKTPIGRFHSAYFGSDILYQDVRESKALAYTVYGRFVEPQSSVEPFYGKIYIGTQADKLADALAAIEALRKNLPLADKTIASARETLRQGVATSRINRENVLYAYDALRQMRLKEPLARLVYEQAPKLTSEDLKNFHQSEVYNRPYTLIAIGDKTRMDLKTLSKYGKIQELTLTEIFGY